MSCACSLALWPLCRATSGGEDWRPTRRVAERQPAPTVQPTVQPTVDSTVDSTKSATFASRPNTTVRNDFQVRPAAAAGPASLPNTAGQVWRDYDISSLTRTATADTDTTQTVRDWILRETGTDTWFGEPVSLLSVDRQRVRVYHTAEVQQQVAGIVARMVAVQNDHHQVGVRLMTVDSPDWRRQALSTMHRLAVRSAGVDAWLMSPEEAAVLVTGLSRRSDFQWHGPADLDVPHARTHTIEQTRPRLYTQAIDLLPAQQWPGYQLAQGQIDEGFQLSLSPLFSQDGSEVEVAVECQVDQVERMADLLVDVPTVIDPRQRVQIQVPQVASWQLRERFRWPSGKVLVVSRGLAAMPGPKQPSLLASLPLAAAVREPPARGEAILVLEAKIVPPRRQPPERSEARTSSLDARGRY